MKLCQIENLGYNADLNEGKIVVRVSCIISYISNTLDQTLGDVLLEQRVSVFCGPCMSIAPWYQRYIMEG